MVNRILDCDPGHDDALAILLAYGCPTIDLLAITTVAGNQTLALRTAAHVHGESGLEGVTLPAPRVPLADEHAVDLIVDLVLGSPGEVTLVPTGPLTNIALALRREPRIATNVREVVLMGGAYTRGNITRADEFNIWVDPEAADVVLCTACGPPFVWAVRACRFGWRGLG